MASNIETISSHPLAEISNNDTENTALSTSLEDDSNKTASCRASSLSPQVENKQQSDFFVVQPDDVHVEMAASNNNHPPAQNGRAVQSCFVDCNNNNNQRRRRSRPKRPVSSFPVVMTTQTALVAELKDVLRRKSKFVEVIPDPNRPGSPGSDGGENDDDDDADYGAGEDEEEEEEEGTTGVETGSNNRSSASPFSNNSTVISSGNGTAASSGDMRAHTPQMPQMCRNVRCAMMGDECDQFFADCQTAANHTYKRTFEVIHDGALVNLQIVAVIGVDNRDEMPRFRQGNQNVDVFLIVFKDVENLQKMWIPQIRRINNEVPIVLAGALPQVDGDQLASKLGAIGYIDLSQTSDAMPVFESAVIAALGLPKNNFNNKLKHHQLEIAQPIVKQINNGELNNETSSIPTVEITPASVNETTTTSQQNGEIADANNNKKANKCCCTIM